ncbi:MAG TPA: MotA/TolQ/ExbB proton channel family protein [Rhizomicrobium sp.]|nr:MotA/TolQ/ExbB proton channel family protein [Rhizomicrobium sp.]
MLEVLHAAVAPVMAGQNVAAAGGTTMGTPGPGLFQGFNIRLEFLHDVVFYILYAMSVIVTFVAIERTIFFWFARGHALRLERALKPGVHSFDEVPKGLLNSRQPAAVAIDEVRARGADIKSRGDLEDATDTAYIHAKYRLKQNMWLLDTIITAAPLLGLLGTILGIIDTFRTLAQSGISDPSAVSKGIGVALFATAIGIATALYALFFHNLFQAQTARILDIIRIILMRVGFVQRAG